MTSKGWRRAGRADLFPVSYRLGIAVAIGSVLLLLFGVGPLAVIGSGGEADKAYLAVPAFVVRRAARAHAGTSKYRAT